MRSWIDSRPLLERAADELRRRGLLADVALVVGDGLPEVPLDAQASIGAVYSLLLDDAARAGASRIDVGGGIRDGRHVAELRDDGRARDVSALAAAARVLRGLGGALSIAFDDGGNVFRLELPCRPTLVLGDALAARGLSP